MLLLKIDCLTLPKTKSKLVSLHHSLILINSFVHYKPDISNCSNWVNNKIKYNAKNLTNE